MRAKGAATLGIRLGQRIRELRKTLSFTQAELAGKTGIVVSYLSMIERAQRIPHVETLVPLAAALGTTLFQLFADVEGLQAKRVRAEDLPLIAYLGNLRLHPRDVEMLLTVAKAMFGGRP